VAETLRRVRQRLRQAQLRRAVEAELRGGAIKVQFNNNARQDSATELIHTLVLRNVYLRLPVVIERIELLGGTVK
jgi:hypothetical protein